MPELPEVETVRLQLKRYIVGHKIVDVKVRYDRVIEGNIKSVIGGIVQDVRRFGKVLVIDMDNKTSLVIHIKLTGQILYRGPNLKNPPVFSKKVVGGVPGKHTHVIFSLDKGGVLYYNDYRRFGWIKIVNTNAVENIDFIKKLGPEPLGKLTFDKFFQVTAKTKRSIKTLIMDQSKIGGVGNIYANDALFLAKIHPERASNSLSKSEAKKLYYAVEEVLRRGLKHGGASELAFVTPDGREGDYQSHTLVYGKEGNPCINCGNKITKKMVGGRGTYFCSNCQDIKSKLPIL